MSYNEYMELLKFHKNGQWELLTKYVDSSAQQSNAEQDHQTYNKRNLEGHLPEDRGTRGQLHGTKGRAKPQMSEEKLEVKSTNPAESAAHVNMPGRNP